MHITVTSAPPQLPELEEAVQKFWDDDQTFKKSVEQRPADKSYVFYDGPPFATGMPHYGHLLASTTKDVIPRYWTMKGYRVERTWGWDCHGLPIENMIEGNLGIKNGKKGIEELGIHNFNQACRNEVLRLDKEWERIIGRLGRWVDFEHNYKTMDTTYMESVWWAFQQLWQKGYVYEGKRVILYCPRCATPLSNFEIAMDNSYKDVTDPSNVYKYKIIGQEDTYFLAWSTTPWNKIVTPALAVHPDLTYVTVQQGSERYILAESTLKMLIDEPHEIVETHTGRELDGWQFETHYNFYPIEEGERAGVIVADEFVTAEEGTGIVTLAVYGEEDFRVMKAHGIQMAEHVDEEGKLKPEVTPWAGLPILKSNPLVNADLVKRGLMYREFPHSHSVPTCYRCGTRLYYAPVPAWFIDIQKLKPQLLKHNEAINWYPEHLKYGRFGKGLETAPDWNISRSRYWGTPMPVWQSADGQHSRIIGSLADLRAWAVNQEAAAKVTDIHREFIDDLEMWLDEEKTVKGRRIREVFDCWVESGSMPFAAVHYPFERKEWFEHNFPAQFISEYIAQTRAWFYCMHVLSVALFDRPGFENALTTGTILAEDGSKMSKSKKNYPDPMGVINKYGVDSLRLYLMSSVVMKGDNLNFSEKEVDDLRKNVFVIWWNVLSFWKQFAVAGVDVTSTPSSVSHVMDRWLLERVNTLVATVTEYMNHYDVVKASRSLIEFVQELSTWYVRLSRERLKDHSQPVAKESSQVLAYTLHTLALLFAPLAPFFSEVVHQSLQPDSTSIHLADWPVATLDQHPELLSEMQRVRAIVERGHAARRATGVKVRQPLSTLRVDSHVLPAVSPELSALIEQELNVKKVEWVTGDQAEEVVFDTVLTPELIAEGQARDLIRQLQNLRKTSGVDVTAQVVATAPEWPAEWEAEIKRKAKLSELRVGPAVALVS